MGETAVVMTAKSVSAGGLSILLLSTFNDVEFVILLSTGIFASIMSFFYEFTHDDKRQKFTSREFTELLRYIAYGTPVMFIVYYLGILNAGQYITLPVTVWGLVGMLCAGSAITIVEFIIPFFGKFLDRRLEK